MPDGEVTLTRTGKVAIVTLDRPEKRNALNPELWSGLDAALGEIERDMPRAVVVTGTGDAFSAGMDVNPSNPQIAGLVEAARTHEVEPMRGLLQSLRPIVDRLAGLPVPTIAALNGLAYGGGAEIAVRCDLRVIDPEAVVCFSEVRLGLMPDLGGGVALTRLIGPARAADLILTARKVRAEEALALGVVNRVSAPGKVVEEAVEMGAQMAANGPRAVRAALEVIRRTPDLGAAEALALELGNAAALMASGECIYGVTALMSRSAPAFPDVEPTEAER